jgi:hypothetical protein
MKKYLLVCLLVCFLGTLLVGCAAAPALAEGGSAAPAAAPTPAPTVELPPIATPAPTVESVDVDLTLLSSTMVVSVMNDIMSKPNEYLGKTFKVRGPYYASYYDVTDQFYHLVYFEDAQACCIQAMEFEWQGDHAYPDDYPAPETKIEITGVFGSYEELDSTYYYLAVDDIVVLE